MAMRLSLTTAFATLLLASLGAPAVGMAQTAVAEAQSADATEAASERPAVRVLAKRFEMRPLEQAVSLRGVSEPARSVSAQAQTSGLVVGAPLRKGARVNAGDVLCEIEPGARAAQLVEAHARLAQAEADAAASERLQRGGYSSETALAADRAALASAQAAVAAIELDLARLSVRAPFDGVLESDTAENGALLQAGSVCAELIAIDPIHFVGYANEIEVGALRLGGAAEARLLDGQTVAAEITFISRSADAATRTFRVEATAPNPRNRPGGELRGGLTVQITIPVAGAQGHFIPSSALTLDSEGRLGVRVVAEDPERGTIARFKPVAILTDAADGVWVSGLARQETIIIRGQEYVSDGAPIAPTLAEE